MDEMEKFVQGVWNIDKKNYFFWSRSNIRGSADQLSLDLSKINMFYRIAKQSFSE